MTCSQSLHSHLVLHHITLPWSWSCRFELTWRFSITFHPTGRFASIFWPSEMFLWAFHLWKKFNSIFFLLEEPFKLSIPRRQDYNIYARRTSNGPYQEFSTSSTEPVHRYQTHMLASPYSLFRNWLIGKDGSYWLLQNLWFVTILFELNYISKLLPSTLWELL